LRCLFFLLQTLPISLFGVCFAQAGSPPPVFGASAAPRGEACAVSFPLPDLQVSYRSKELGLFSPDPSADLFSSLEFCRAPVFPLTSCTPDSLFMPLGSLSGLVLSDLLLPVRLRIPVLVLVSRQDIAPPVFTVSARRPAQVPIFLAPVEFSFSQRANFRRPSSALSARKPQ
jgi:hypothetical protein